MDYKEYKNSGAYDATRKSDILIETDGLKGGCKLRSHVLKNGNESLYIEQYDKNTGKRPKTAIATLKNPYRDETGKQYTQIYTSDIDSANKTIFSKAKQQLYNEATTIKRNIIKNDIFVVAEKMKQEEFLKYGKSIASFNSMIKSYQNWSEHETRVEKINDTTIKNYYNYINTLTDKRGKPYYKPNTKAIRIKLFKQLIRYACTACTEKGLKQLKCTRENDIEADTLTRKELITLIRTKVSPRYEQVKSAFIFSCFTGLRPSDLLRLQYSDLETTGNEIRVHCIPHKTQKDNSNDLNILLPKEAIKPLTYIDTNKIGSKEFIFNSYTPKKAISFINRLAQENGINKHLTRYTARRTFATIQLTENKADIKVISKLMGHTNITQTLRYQKTTQKDKDNAMNIFANFIK